ncbi:MAG: PLP-dependent aminotransferase family protein, partial [Treponemataceae bacterium]|nr:PLP-dependent aminotransferase family protein [Treponemataceae bacterium]
MITCDFEKRGAAGLCDFLYGSIRQQILDGTLRADEKLPSKRSLAGHLGVSVTTVQNAYGQLISEGYLYSIEKKGFFVTDISSAVPLKPPEAPPAGTPPHDEDRFRTRAEAPDAPAEPPEWFADFGSNATSCEKFPFSLWAHVMRKVLRTADEALLKSSPAAGIPELRSAVADYLRQFRNMNVQPDQIVIGAGTESLYAAIVQLLGRERAYAVENPGYRKVAEVLRLNGGRCIPIGMDAHGIRPDALEQSGAQIVHVSPSHHFPTGIVMPVRRRMELLGWAAADSARRIIEDDYDSEFRFNGKPLQTMQGADAGGRVIYVNTFSKTLSPSFRIGYMVLPPNLVPLFAARMGAFANPVSAFEQRTLAEFIKKGFFAAHIIRMKNYYRTLRNNLIQSLHGGRLADILDIREEEAGLHFL